MNFNFFIVRGNLFLRDTTPSLLGKESSITFSFQNPPKNAAVYFVSPVGERFIRELDSNGGCAIPVKLLGDADGTISIIVAEAPPPFKTYQSNSLQIKETDDGYIVFPCLEVATKNALSVIEDMDNEIHRFREELEALNVKLQKYMEGYELV